MFIAEQQLVAAATGLAVRGYRAFASTFAAFLTRAYDFIRMGAISGVAPAARRIARGRRDRRRRPVADGAGRPRDDARRARLERALPGRRHQHGRARRRRWPTCRGISYLRTTRGAYPGLYATGEQFRVGGSKVLRSSPADQVTLVGAGVTLHECLRAADQLAGEGIAARVIDCYSVKPVDAATLAAAADATAGRVVVAEDHHPEGGLGSAVADALLAAGQRDPRRHAPRRARDARLRLRRRTARLGRHRRRTTSPTPPAASSGPPDSATRSPPRTGEPSLETSRLSFDAPAPSAAVPAVPR